MGNVRKHQDRANFLPSEWALFSEPRTNLGRNHMSIFSNHYRSNRYIGYSSKAVFLNPLIPVDAIRYFLAFYHPINRGQFGLYRSDDFVYLRLSTRVAQK